MNKIIKIENRLKVIIIYGFFFTCPILAPFIPEIDTPMGKLNNEMIWLLIISFMSIYFVINKKKIFISSLVKVLILYYLFTLLNAAFQGHFSYIIKTNVLLLITSVLFLVIIENINFTEIDKERTFKLLKYFVFILFCGTIVQQTYNLYFFTPEDRLYELRNIDFQGYWRSTSFFNGMMQNQGGIGIIMLVLIFFFPKNTMTWRNSFFISILLVVAYFSYTRYVFISIILIFLFFLSYNFWISSKAKIVIVFWLLITILTSLFFYDSFTKSDFYHTRVMADFSGRTSDPIDFISQYIDQHPIITGTGFSSYSKEYFYGSIRRLHSGIWDLFFKDGIIGLILFLVLLYFLHKKALLIFKAQNKPVYLMFSPLIFLINLTADLNTFFYWGYLLVMFFMEIDFKLSKNSTN